MGNEEKPPDDLKQRINQLLWTSLPGSTKLDEADSLSMMIYVEIMKDWNKKGEK